MVIHKNLPFKLFLSYMKWENMDHEDVLTALARGFPSTDNFKMKFRIRPNAALLKNLHLRLHGHTKEAHKKTIKNYMHTIAELTKEGIFVPGCAAG